MDLTVGETYIVSRSLTPAVAGSGLAWPEESIGGQAEWFWGVPGVFRALASPRTAQPVPAAPRSADAPHSQSLGYWGALQYLLIHRLGWAKPHRGLMRWYGLGKPTDDPTLALVSEVWDRDGWLDVYLAWLLKRQPHFLRDDAPTAPHELEQLDPTWSTWLERASDDLKAAPAPHFSLDGGYDNLHLTGHVGETGHSDPQATLSITDAGAHRAVYVTDRMSAWYWDLRDQTLALPASPRSWRVDVFVRPVGFLGAYRVSRSTGLMFTGRHRHHSMGN